MEKGLCHICGKISSATCRMCGRATCDKHLKSGVCSSCSAGRQVK